MTDEERRSKEESPYFKHFYDFIVEIVQEEVKNLLKPKCSNNTTNPPPDAVYAYDCVKRPWTPFDRSKLKSSISDFVEAQAHKYMRTQTDIGCVIISMLAEAIGERLIPYKRKFPGFGILHTFTPPSSSSSEKNPLDRKGYNWTSEEEQRLVGALRWFTAECARAHGRTTSAITSRIRRIMADKTDSQLGTESE